MGKRDRKKIAILGSTGSIGTQALDVIREHRDYFEVEVLTAQNNAEILIKQALEFKPNAVVIGAEEKYGEVADILQNKDIKVFTGIDALSQVVAMDPVDIVLTALVGYSGLKPTIAAVEAGKNIALANKETLVVAGNLITELARENGVNILPVDSEHSAILQCLTGEVGNKVEKIVLTASGGPFRGMTIDDLKHVTKAEALQHPNWDMGDKITIDSATLMNKGLEVIEARWLFGVNVDQIEVVIHPQSIIHSMVQFEDGSIKAQLGLPDMKLPILYALTYPKRLSTEFQRFNFADYPALTFEKPDAVTFRNLDLAYESIRRGGNIPCVLNAANEIAVREFLNGKVGFLQMPEIVETCMAKIPFIAKPAYDDYVETDRATRIKALEYIK